MLVDTGWPEPAGRDAERIVGMMQAGVVLHSCRMGHTLTVRLTPDLAAWLKHAADTTGVSQGEIIREQLQKAREEDKKRAFMRLAGTVNGPRDLSSRKGFATE